MKLATVRNGSSGSVHPERPRGRGGYILWLTGLSGAGKSTLSRALRPALEGERPVEILDGDEVHLPLRRARPRPRRTATNVRRIGFVARLLAARNRTAAVTAAISPYAGTRDEVRSLAERDGVPFVEVHVAAPVAALAERDVKGSTARRSPARSRSSRGVSDPYEPPARPDVVVRTDVETVEESAGKILEHLRQRGLLRVAGVEVATS